MASQLVGIPQSLPLSVVILCKNEAGNLPGCLDSLAGVVEDVHVVDSGSTDDTVAMKQTGAISDNRLVSDSEHVHAL